MKIYLKTFSITLAIIIVFAIFINFDTVSSFANENVNTIEVDTYGTKSKGASMFSEGLWVPGVEQSGIIRLTNNYSQKVKVNNLSLTMALAASDGTPIEFNDDLFKKYAESMKLTIKKGTMLLFNETIYSGDFYGMLFEVGQNNFTGYKIPSSKQFNINKDESVELKYTVKMDEDVGNELQGLVATVIFIVNINENLPPDFNNDPPDTNNKPSVSEEVVDETIPESGVTDITGHWAEDCINRLIKAGIITGYPDGTIRPDINISRAETAVLITKALNLEEVDIPSVYKDPMPEWARGYINVTTKEGIFEGYPISGGRIFKPEGLITREEMASVLMRGFKIKLDGDVNLEFIDKDHISSWALDHIKAGTQKGIITGYPDKTFKPQGNITRAEAFTMICKLLGNAMDNR